MTRFVTKTTLCSTLAIATAMVMAPQRAAAQSLVGSVNYTSPNVVSVNQSVANQTTVTLNAGQSVINWGATNAAVAGVRTFQPNGTTATFTGASDFAVLNRVGAGFDAIKLDGTINSLVNGQVGGTVYFQSNNGIVIGHNAVINVGSLGLTTLDRDDDGFGNWMDNFGTSSPSVTFNTASNPNSYIRVEAGAQLNANSGGNYVAVVAPKITHRGIIRTDGGAALVAAEAATVTFRPNNLYDITVTQGSKDANGVVVNGGTIARNDPTAGIDHRAYLVAVPANSAMTMIIQNGASLGFDIAGSAVYENNAVVLTTGRDIGFGSASGVSAGAGTTDADIQISRSLFSSDTFATASDNFHAGSDGGLLDFGGNLSVEAARGQIDSQGAQGLTKVGGNLYATTNRYGANGQNSTAGNFTLLAIGGSTLQVDGYTQISANGYGGYSTISGVAGGNGIGGNITVQAQAGSTINLADFTSFDANGYGGGVNFDTSTGGSGRGGQIFVAAVGAGALVHFSGAASIDAIGYGAGANSECQACEISGGNGVGGKIFIDTYQTGSARIAFDQYLDAFADGYGGGGVGPLTTGNATGGTVRLYQSSTTGNITVTGPTKLSADGNGAFSNDGVSGAGTGGVAQINALSGQISLSGVNDVSALGNGGDTVGAVGAGAGQGGSVQINPSSGSTVSLGDYFNADASGNGGSAFNDLGTGGMGQGGNVTVQMSGGTLNGATTMNLLADGIGGSTGNDCTAPCGFVGAIGIGGLVALYGGPAGSTMALGTSTYLSAIGQGASGGTGTGGLGNGGTAILNAANATVTGGELTLNASGRGGQSSGDAGGVATGGLATLQIDGGSVTLTGDVTLDVTANAGGSDSGAGSAATGGNSHVYLFNAGADLTIGGATTLDGSALGGPSIGGNGGLATGGFAQIYTTAGTAQFDGSTTLQANAVGGGSVSGDGATAAGGRAIVNTAGAALSFGSTLSTHANAVGGNGVNGGDAVGAAESPGFASGVYARGGGSVNVIGGTSITATMTGGAGQSGGAGGAATGLFDYHNPNTNELFVLETSAGVMVGTNLGGTGSATFADVMVDTSAVGGIGGGSGQVSSAGGNGGSATGGSIRLETRNTETGTNLLSATSMTLISSATGGSGGAGGVNAVGYAGGAGGDARSGFIAVTASAGNGRIESGPLTITATATGGTGGNGGDADNTLGTTGAGGEGGTARAGGTATGVVSNNATATNNGSALFGDIAADVRAFGGDGGSMGGLGSSFGAGGNGGVAYGGSNIFYSRGGDVQFGNINLDTTAFGGDGSTSSNIGGVGGNAYGGSVQFLSTTRFQFPGQVGSLVAGSVVVDASAYAGGGLTTGQALLDATQAQGRLGVEVLGGSSAQFGSLYLLQEAADGAVANSAPSYITVSGAGSSVDVTGNLTLDTDGTLTVRLDGGTMTAGSVLLSAGDFVPNAGTVGTMGSITADSIFVASGNNVLIDANLISTGIENDISFDTIGFVQTGSLTSVNGVYVTSDNYISTGNIVAGGLVELVAPGLIQTGDINSDGDQTVTAGGQFVAGNLSAGGAISVLASNGVNAGTIGAAGDITLRGNTGDVVTGDVTSGGGAVDLRSATGITVGNLSASTTLDVRSGGNITALSLAAGELIYVRASGNASLGVITGSGDADIATSSTVTTGDVTIDGALDIRSQLGMTLGDLSAGDYIDLRSSGSIALGDAASGETVNIITPGTLTGGSITAGNSVFARSMLAMNLGAVSAGIVSPSSAQGAAYLVRLASNSAMTIGNVEALGDVGFSTPAALVAGNITSGGGIMALVSGNMSFGSLTTTAPAGYVYLADNSMAVLGGPFETFNRAPILSATPVATLGSITINGPVATGMFRAAAGTSLQSGALTTDTAVDITAVGGITTGAITSGDWIDILAGGDIVVGAVRSASYTDLDAGGSLTGTTISAGAQASLWGETGVSVGAVDAGIVNPDISTGAVYDIGIGSGPTGNIVTGALTGASDVGIGAGGNLTTGAIQGGGDMLAMVGGTTTLGAISLPGTLGVTGYDMLAVGGGKGDFDKTIVIDALFAGTASRTGVDVTLTGAVDAAYIFILAGGDLFGFDFNSANDLLFDATGDIAVENLIADGEIDVTAGGALAITGVLDGFALALSAGTDLTLGDITSNSAISFTAAGNLTVGNLTTVAGTFDGFAAFIAPGPLDISLRAGGDLTTGVLISGGSIYLGAEGAISAQQMTAVGAVLALAAGDISTGAIVAGDVVYMAGIGEEVRGGFIGDGFDPGPVVDSPPTSLAASITTGTISAADLTLGATGAVTLSSAASTGAALILGGDVTAGGLSATSLGVSATGLVSVNGTWAAGPLEIIANDLAIGTDGSVRGGAVQIVSTNDNGMFLGDGLTGDGFMLSQAEASKVSGSSLAFGSAGSGTRAMSIGDLSLNAGQMSGTELMQFAAGTIRIVGDMAINGLTDPASAIGFYAPLFMIDAGTGSLALNNGSALGGTLNIYAHDVWVADSAILARLLADPNYAGRDAELAVAPNGVSGPVINANVINVEFNNNGPRTVTPYTLLVQNTGSATIQQGFLATEANATLGEGASGLIDMVINGQGQTDAGIISGVAVRDGLMEGDDPARFTANSTINGCSVGGGACSQTPPNELPPIPDPGVVIADEIALFSSGAEDKPLFGNEQQIVDNLEELIYGSELDPEDAEAQAKQDEEEAAEEASSPISPPTPLFDTRPLNAKSSTDEPISGGGNPALIGSEVEPSGGQQ